LAALDCRLVFVMSPAVAEVEGLVIAVPTRRAALARAAKVAALLAGAGVLGGAARAASAASESAWNARAFEAKSVAEALRALGQALPVESREVTLVAPDIAENGAAVPIAVASSLAGVRRMLVLVERNPAVLSAAFDVSDTVFPEFALRVKMNQSSDVYAVALLNDGRAFFARKDVRVTLGGCAA
jgi:sulfur-oxidizing protein SoxY